MAAVHSLVDALSEKEERGMTFVKTTRARPDLLLDGTTQPRISQR